MTAPEDPGTEKPPENAHGATSSAKDESVLDEGREHVAGDRGIPSINRARSMQSRVSSLLAITLMSVLGLGFLTWYYAKALTRPGEAQHAAQAAARNRAQSEMALPSIDIRSPLIAKTDHPAVAPPGPSLAEAALGSAPPLPDPTEMSVATLPAAPSTAVAVPVKTAAQLALDRRLSGPAFAREAGNAAGSPPVTEAVAPPDMGSLGVAGAAHAGAPDSSAQVRTLDGLLKPTITTAVAASLLPTRRFLLAKGAFLDCTLETAIDSTLPGMTTCITATDTFGADGTVVLLERGTKLVGETRGQVQQGAARIFVLWSEARTPSGVVVPLSSPGADELGRSGLPGEVNRHFWDRFGAAILLSVVNGAVQGLANSQNRGGSVSVSPSTSTDVMSEVLRSTIDIAPTVTKAQGDRIQVFVARDVDFRPVYTLRTANAEPERSP